MENRAHNVGLGHLRNQTLIGMCHMVRQERKSERKSTKLERAIYHRCKVSLESVASRRHL